MITKLYEKSLHYNHNSKLLTPLRKRDSAPKSNFLSVQFSYQLFLAIDTEVPYLDDRPLAVAGTPEVRHYRLRYWDKGIANGDWSDVAAVTVGP